MNIYFSGIGGVGLGPLAEIAHDAGHQVQGSDSSETLMTEQLTARGIAVNTKQKGAFLQAVHRMKPVDWFVYTAALPEDHPELTLARQLGIKTTKRDELLSYLIQEKNLKLIAISGAHGKTTTTAMVVWALKQLGIPVSYSVGTTLSFGPSGFYDPASEYFVYECDEFDRNFLHFQPYLSIITTIDYDHPDTYGTPEDYMAAFRQFMDQSQTSVMWQSDGVIVHATEQDGIVVPDDQVADIKLPGLHNRRNATLVVRAFEKLGISGDVIGALSSFPGSQRRFEKLATNLYTDYGHHPTEISAMLEMTRELSDDVVLVYQPHQNVRQHEIKNLYTDCFEQASEVYWLPTYLTRENPDLPILTPEQLTEDISNRDRIHIVGANDDLWGAIQQARARGALVLVMGAGSIDSWLRDKVQTPQFVHILVMDQEGSIILQRGPDDIATGTPGQLASFNGKVEDSDISLLAAAVRVLRQATNLTFEDSDLSYFKTFPRTVENHGEKSLITYYTLAGINSQALEVHTGNGFERINQNELSGHHLQLLDRTAIAEFTHPTL